MNEIPGTLCYCDEFCDQHINPGNRFGDIEAVKITIHIILI